MKSQHERWLIGAGKHHQEQLKLRQNSYDKRPDKCIFCKKDMPYASLKERSKRKFCNRSCSARHNNQNRVKQNTVYQKGITKKTICSICKKNINIGKNANHKAAKCVDCKKTLTAELKIKNCKCCNIQFSTIKERVCCSDICTTNLKQKGSSLGGKISASKRIKRSKNEVKLYELCKGYFNSVRHNEIIEDGWDADIIIDDHKLSILWNGAWHYKQLTFNNHSLKQVQTRDKIKTDVLTANGWTVISFNDNEYSPDQAFNILKSGYRGRI